VINVLTIGTFDGLHVGHLELLRGCRAIAGDNRDEARVIAGVNTDAFVERYKGKPPVHPYAHRAELVDAVRFVDTVLPNMGDEDAKPLIEAVAADVIVIGDDWLDEGRDETRYMRQLDVTQGWLTQRGIRIVYLPRTRGVSSSALRKAS
jgi:glycerol-3-phosphate cytidylyltransferase